MTANGFQRISSMGNITLSSEDRGPRTPGSRGESPCKSTPYSDRRLKVYEAETETGWANESSVNWYQRNYLYAWVGARLVRDMP